MSIFGSSFYRFVINFNCKLITLFIVIEDLVGWQRIYKWCPGDSNRLNTFQSCHLHLLTKKASGHLVLDLGSYFCFHLKTEKEFQLPAETTKVNFLLPSSLSKVIRKKKWNTMTDSSSSNELLFYVVENGFSAAVWKKSSFLMPVS